jgi:hypothetical protein
MGRAVFSRVRPGLYLSGPVLAGLRTIDLRDCLVPYPYFDDAQRLRLKVLLRAYELTYRKVGNPESALVFVDKTGRPLKRSDFAPSLREFVASSMTAKDY